MTAVTDAFAAIGEPGLGTILDGVFDQVEWAEEEIKAAQERHPDAAAAIWDSFLLLRSTHERLGAEMVYRAHVRELLDRIAAGKDLRPCTDAELVCALSRSTGWPPGSVTKPTSAAAATPRRPPALSSASSSFTRPPAVTPTGKGSPSSSPTKGSATSCSTASTTST